MQSSTEKRNTSSTTELILEKVAEEEACGVTELPAIYENIDPEALESLVQSGEVSIEFQYCDHEVVIKREGRVTIE